MESSSAGASSAYLPRLPRLGAGTAKSWVDARHTGTPPFLSRTARDGRRRVPQQWPACESLASATPTRMLG
ncbi:MAG: hypothetical protein ACK53L_27540 [Pirellulaceae bacterium]